MAKSPASIYFPSKLSDIPEDPLPEAVLDRQYAHLQVELIRATYAKAAALGGTHDAPEASTFLELFVNLIDTMEINNPDQAHLCMMKLKKILNAIYPATINGAATENSSRTPKKIVKH